MYNCVALLKSDAFGVTKQYLWQPINKVRMSDVITSLELSLTLSREMRWWRWCHHNLRAPQHERQSSHGASSRFIRAHV